MATDGVFRTRSLGLPVEGVRDQYADGRAAKVWEVFIGDKKSRTRHYKDFLVGLLRRRGCRRVLDVAAGTGIDSVMLLEEGFEVVSVDASDKMLKHAFKTRWERRRDPAFDNWVIEEANWLTLTEDIREHIGDGFDAVICLGNSFAHMMDTTGDQSDQKKALSNFEQCVRPGGLLLIDHRNFDFILDNGSTPARSIYYNCKHTTDIRTTILYVGTQPAIVTMDYLIDVSGLNDKESKRIEEAVSEFRLCYYPHRLKVFTQMLDRIMPYASEHVIYADFKQIDEVEDPAFYIHLIQKAG
ncbi:Glycine N-methyltransferase [Frankliniella fusca]|uniref:Glycine N-methyltransferase n=2 Tax=Arthropoda TaxID=6656 RepID=A0AAE1HLZ6_9NEOP|nr:Glycine N-methyltransferase [Frankliniella fusca]